MHKLTVFLLCALLCGPGALFSAQKDWPTYGGDSANTRYSSLKQVNRSNVGKLARAWTYHMSAPTSQAASGKQGKGGGGRTRSSEATPIVAGGLKYLPTPFNRVVALEPETGKEVWSYEIAGANASARGVEYWPGDKQSPPSIFFGTTNGLLMALNAKTGKPVPGFGEEGFINMKGGGLITDSPTGNPACRRRRRRTRMS